MKLVRTEVFQDEQCFRNKKKMSRATDLAWQHNICLANIEFLSSNPGTYLPTPPKEKAVQSHYIQCSP